MARQGEKIRLFYSSNTSTLAIHNSTTNADTGFPRQRTTPQSLIRKRKREIRILGFTAVITDDESEGREGTSTMTPMTMMGTAQADTVVGREHCLYEGEKGEKVNTEVQELDLTLKL